MGHRKGKETKKEEVAKKTPTTCDFYLVIFSGSVLFCPNWTTSVMISDGAAFQLQLSPTSLQLQLIRLNIRPRNKEVTSCVSAGGVPDTQEVCEQQPGMSVRRETSSGAENFIKK